MRRRSAAPPQPARVRAETIAWLEQAVIGLNLCPFARAVHLRGGVRCVVSSARDTHTLLTELAWEMQTLAAADPAEVETTLLVHPQVLQDFLDFNDFLDLAEAALVQLGLEGVLQVASFHPGYRFEGSGEDDITDATNRSPWPTLHLLREDSVERVLEAGADPHAIVERNLRTLRTLGVAGWAALQARCRRQAADQPDEDKPAGA